MISHVAAILGDGTLSVLLEASKSMADWVLVLRFLLEDDNICHSNFSRTTLGSLLLKGRAGSNEMVASLKAGFFNTPKVSLNEY
jgi:hypothetical protein